MEDIKHSAGFCQIQQVSNGFLTSSYDVIQPLYFSRCSEVIGPGRTQGVNLSSLAGGNLSLPLNYKRLRTYWTGMLYLVSGNVKD